MQKQTSVKEDIWIPTSCNMCFNSCNIRVRRQDGVITKIEGDKNSPIGEGHVCGKGATGMMQLYDPNRITKPMKRTNPQKGKDIDPGWVEISWEECYSIVEKEIKKTIANKGVNGLCHHSFITNFPGTFNLIAFFGMALGAPNFVIPDICGAAIHGVESILTTGCNAGPDYEYCKYILQFGSQAGTATRHGFNMTVRRFADARAKGARLVNVDPHMSAGPENADLWLPIRPGTDAALALSIAYVLVHELGIYDRDYLKKYTNAASLVDVKTGRIMRETGSNKPYVWDEAEGKAKVFDDPDIASLALEGAYTVDGVACKTGFQLYADSIKNYMPEDAEKITTVPAARIRQVAKELGEAACIGSTITLDGVEMPYRPAAVDSFSGISRHKHGFLTHWAILSLNTLIGSCNVPGGLIAYAPISLGHPETGKPAWKPSIWEEENLLEHIDLNFTGRISVYDHTRNHVGDKGDMMLFGLMPINELDPHFLYVTQMNPEKYGREKMDFLFVYAGNPVKSWGNHDEMGKFLKSFEFIAGMDLYLNDSSYFFDLIIPEATYLERYDFPPTLYNNHRTNWAHKVDWCWGIRQPVIKSPDNLPGVGDFFNELARRLGKTAEWNNALNFVWKMEGDKGLKPDVTYTFPQILDHIYKNWFGESHGLEWFKQNGIIKYPRKVEEMYLFPQMQSRIPFYWDFMLEAKEKVAAEAKRMGLEDWELVEYRPLPEWLPCHDYEIHNKEYDLLPIYYTNAINVDTWLLHNPWVNEINLNEPYGYNIEINSETAKQKGLASGDRVILKAANNYEVSGRLLIVEGLHPECLAVGGGSWDSTSRYMPVAKGRGVSVNNLLEALSTERLCHLSATYDQCVRVKVIKV